MIDLVADNSNCSGQGFGSLSCLAIIVCLIENVRSVESWFSPLPLCSEFQLGALTRTAILGVP